MQQPNVAWHGKRRETRNCRIPQLDGLRVAGGRAAGAHALRWPKARQRAWDFCRRGSNWPAGYAYVFGRAPALPQVSIRGCCNEDVTIVGDWTLRFNDVKQGQR